MKKQIASLLLCFSLCCQAADTSAISDEIQTALTNLLHYIPPDSEHPFIVMNQHPSAPAADLVCRIFLLTDSLLIIYRTSKDEKALESSAPRFQAIFTPIIEETSIANMNLIERILAKMPTHKPNDPVIEYTFLTYHLSLFGSVKYVSAQITPGKSEVKFLFDKDKELVRLFDGRLSIGTPPESNTTANRIEQHALETLTPDQSKSLFIFDHKVTEAYLKERYTEFLEKVRNY